MATEAFLQFTKPTIQGIQVVGETVDPAFKGAIEVLDFTFGAENATTGALVGTPSAINWNQVANTAQFPVVGA